MYFEGSIDPAMEKPYRLIISEDHTVLREGLRALIDSRPVSTLNFMALRVWLISNDICEIINLKNV